MIPIAPLVPLLNLSSAVTRPARLGHADVKTARRYARSELEDRAALEDLDRG